MDGGEGRAMVPLPVFSKDDRMVKVLVAAALLIVATSPPSLALPQKVVNSCSPAQLRTPQAGSCLEKQRQDIIHSRPTHHFVYCSSSGALLCCEAKDGYIVPHSCTVMGPGRPNPKTGVVGPPSKSVERKPKAPGSVAPPNPERSR